MNENEMKALQYFFSLREQGYSVNIYGAPLHGPARCSVRVAKGIEERYWVDGQTFSACVPQIIDKLSVPEFKSCVI